MSYPPPPPPHMHGAGQPQPPYGMPPQQQQPPQQPRPPVGYGPPRPGGPPMGGMPAAPGGGYPQAPAPPQPPQMQQMQAPRPPSPVAPRPPGMPPMGMGAPRPPVGPPGSGYGAPTPPPPGPQPPAPGAYRPPSAGGFPGAGAPPHMSQMQPPGGPVRPPASPMAPPPGPPGAPGGIKVPSPVPFQQQPPPPGGAPSPRPPAAYGAPPTPTPPAPMQPQPPRPGIGMGMPQPPAPMMPPGSPRPPMPPGAMPGAPPPPRPPGMMGPPPPTPPPPGAGAPGPQQPGPPIGPPAGPGGMMPPRGMAPAPPRPAVPFYSTGGGQPQQQPQAPPMGPPGPGGMARATPPPPGGMMPPPPVGPPGGAAGPVQQLAGQFGQMGMGPPGPPGGPQRPPPMGSIAGGGGMAPPPPGQPASQYDMQSPPVYPGAYPGVRGAAQSQMEGMHGHGHGGMPGAVGGPPMTPGGMPGMEAANQLPTLAEVDLSITCDPRFMRFSVGRIPNSQNNAAAAKLPLGVIVQPMALDDKAPEVAGGVPVDVVNFGATGIVRCRKCRTYINPFISWLDNGRRWRCNVCGALNDVPAPYFHPLDPATGARRDKYERPELCKGSVEFVAPGEYMVRPPQPAVYVFVVDVSYAAVSAGVVARAAATIKASLDALPGEPRTQFGLVTYDSTVHFYSFKPGLKQPQVLVVPDIAELFVPQPEDLLVNLKDSRAVIDQLLDALPAMYAGTRNVETALGPALTGAYRVMATVGGKMVVLSAAMPTLGDGRLKHREDARALGTEREHQQLNPEETWYRTKAVEFSRVQISVDLFLFSPTGAYADVASLATLPRFTAGGLYFYPHYADAKDGPRFAAELSSLLTRPTGFEAVMRVRATRGLKVTQFYGSYYIRGTDLLALPNCSAESVFGVEMAHDEAFLTASVISVQAALLHTTSSGERRIRVHTLAAPVTAIVQEVIASVDVDALCNLMAKRSIETALKSGLDAARHRLQQQCADILRACRGFAAAPMGMGMMGPPGQMQPQQQQQAAALPPTLELLPLYCMALAKNVCFRGGNEVRPDARSYAMSLLGNMNADTSRVFIYPRLFALHAMPPEAGRTLAECPAPANAANAEGQPAPAPAPPTAGKDAVRLPPAVNLTIERFASDGVFLLENGVALWLWVGSRADPALLVALFGGHVTSLEGQDPASLAQLFEQQAQAGSGQAGSVGARVQRIVAALREERPLRHLALTVVLEGDQAGAPFYWNLVEDRQHFPGGQHNYPEYMALVGRQQPGPPGAYGPPPGMM